MYASTRKPKKYAIGYDATNKRITTNVIVKPVNLHDKSQWICSDAGAGILNFFYSLNCFIHIEIERDPELGMIPVMRSDVWQNAFFTFGDNGEIFVDFNKGGKDAGGDKYCLAFRKDQLSYSDNLKTVSELASEWNKEYKYFDSSSVQTYDPDGNKKEGFISRCWNWLKEDFIERMDGEPSEGGEEAGSGAESGEPSGEGAGEQKEDVCYLELVNYNTIDKEAYNCTWAFQEVWDIRTATNIALETKQINDLEEIDKIALENKELAYEKLKSMYEAEKALWTHEKAEYDSHLMTRYYTMDE